MHPIFEKDLAQYDSSFKWRDRFGGMPDVVSIVDWDHPSSSILNPANRDPEVIERIKGSRPPLFAASLISDDDIEGSDNIDGSIILSVGISDIISSIIH